MENSSSSRRMAFHANLPYEIGLFLIALGGLNEVVQRLASNDVWAAFRVYGILGLNGLFFLTQLPIIKHHMTEEIDGPAA